MLNNRAKGGHVDKSILTPADVAAELGIDPSTARRYWTQIGGVKIGSRTYRVTRERFMAYMNGENRQSEVEPNVGQPHKEEPAGRGKLNMVTIGPSRNGLW